MQRQYWPNVLYMIGLFRYSSPLQWGVLFLMVFAFRIPLLWSDNPLLAEDLKHLVLGQKMADGFLLYRDIIDDTPPLPAFLYYLSSLLFGRSLLALQLIAGILIYIEAMLLNYIVNKNKLSVSRTDLPALAYILCSGICYDFLSLSPSLVANLFILVSLDRILRHIRSETNEGEIFGTGFYIGLAYLCFAPTALLLVMAILGFVLYTRTPLQKYFLLGFGFIFPLAILLIYYFVRNDAVSVVNYYFLEFPGLNALGFRFDIGVVLLMLSPTILLFIIGFFTCYRYSRFINYQILAANLMTIGLVLSLLLIVLFFSVQVSHFLILLPFVSYFICQYFIVTKYKFIANFLIWVLVVISVQVTYSHFKISMLPKVTENFNHQVVERQSSPVSGKKLLVLGDSLWMYQFNEIGSPFYNWSISKDKLLHITSFDQLLYVNDQFYKDLPEVIWDQDHYVEEVFERLPGLRKKYIKSGDRMYILKKEKLGA